MSKEQQVGLGIAKIKELAFSINSADLLPGQLSFAFGFYVEFDQNANTFEIQISADLKEEESKEVLVHIKVSNLFLIQDLIKFYDEKTNSLDLPDGLLITMLSISFTHTRALMAKNTAGTIYEKHLIPIINPSDMAKEVFEVKY